MKKYTFSRTIHTPEGVETFSAVEFDSFDEAKKAVEKGIRDRKLELPDSPRGLQGLEAFTGGPIRPTASNSTAPQSPQVSTPMAPSSTNPGNNEGNASKVPGTPSGN